MFIVWGKKYVYRNLGYVADFCSVCRDAKGFLLRRVGLANHVYYLTVGEGELAGHDRICETCKTTFNADAQKYAGVSKKAGSLAELQEQTYPNLQKDMAERMALEEKIRNNPASLTEDERNNVIRAPFALLSPKVETRFASTHIDKETGIAIACALGLLIMGPGIFTAISNELTDIGFLSCTVVGIGLIIWQASMSGRRYMRREIIPALATTLRPLKPTEAELKTILGELRQFKHKMGKKLRLDDLQAELENPAIPG